ncbi:MAG: hypothetical protein Q9203_007198 [Teloschistes exilis]
MAAGRKYAALLDLDDAAPDIYETPELTDDNSTIPASSILQTESRSSSPFEPETGNSAIDRHRIDPNEARNNFLTGNNERETSQSWIGRQRDSYRTSNKRIRNDGIVEDLANISDEDDEDSLERKLTRLRLEVAEVKEAFQRKGKETKVPKIVVGEDKTETLDALTRVLDSIERPEGSNQKNSPSRLAKRLSVPSASSQMQAQHTHADEPVGYEGDSTTPQDTSSYDASHTMSKVSDFDKRLRLLEAALGMDALPLPTQDRATTQSVLPTLDSLDRRVSSISITDSSLDKISRQVKQMAQDTEKLTEARKAAVAENKSSSERKRLSASRTGSQAANEVEQSDQTSKINALYGTLSTIESLSPLLPSVLDRLRSLRTIHADAALASENLVKVESRQAAMTEELKEWKEGLEKVESSMKTGEASMKDNMDVVDRWVKELEDRLRKSLNPSTSTFARKEPENLNVPGLAIGPFLEDIMQLYSSKLRGPLSTHYSDEVRIRWPSCMADLDAFWSPRLGKNSLEALKKAAKKSSFHLEAPLYRTDNGAGATHCAQTVPRQLTLHLKFTDRAVSLVPEANAMNVYRGLFYNAWDLINLESPVSGLAPHTEPNAIATSLVVAQAMNGTPTFTVDFPGSTSLFFDLFSFYFGCVLPTAQGVVQAAQQCSILVAGFDAFNKERAVATFTFTPPTTNLLKPPMIQAILPSSFVGLHNVSLIQSNSITQVLLVDDPMYRLHTSSEGFGPA